MLLFGTSSAGNAFVAMVCLLSNSFSYSQSPQFPTDFRWCVATSAHQIEGGNTQSDWAHWEAQPGRIKRNEQSGEASGHWTRIAEDTALMKTLGVDTYRMSIEWAKLEPTQGHWDLVALAHYRDEVRQLKDAGIRPLVTLHHFTFPQWVAQRGGWEWQGLPDAMALFTAKVLEVIGDDVSEWITINEPMVAAMGGYLNGHFPPGEKRPIKGLVPVIKAMLLTHARMYDEIHQWAKQRGIKVRVGLAHHLRVMKAKRWWHPLDHLTAYFIERAWNWSFPDALAYGRLKLIVPGAVDFDEDLPTIKGKEDFFGLNYYTGDLVEYGGEHGFTMHTRNGVPKNELGWDIWPQGLAKVLRLIHRRYLRQPIFITENGLADRDDDQRSSFLKEHVKTVVESIAKGIKIEGYCHWSLLDNFEWSEGFEPRFGLVAVDYTTMERTPRPSFDLYRRMIAARRWDP